DIDAEMWPLRNAIQDALTAVDATYASLGRPPPAGKIPFLCRLYCPDAGDLRILSGNALMQRRIRRHLRGRKAVDPLGLIGALRHLKQPFFHSAVRIANFQDRCRRRIAAKTEEKATGRRDVERPLIEGERGSRLRHPGNEPALRHVAWMTEPG